MYVYQLTHVNGIRIKVIGYFGSWKKSAPGDEEISFAGTRI